MSEGIFLGRKFTLPYDTSADHRIAQMARAQIVTQVASPGTIVQAGDKILPIGVTRQEVRMGDLDVRLRSFDQLSAPAQDVVRRNIQWQYGEQVQEEPHGSQPPATGEMAKGFFSDLLGINHLRNPQNVSYGPDKSGRIPSPSLFSTRVPTPRKPKASPATKTSATQVPAQAPGPAPYTSPAPTTVAAASPAQTPSTSPAPKASSAASHIVLPTTYGEEMGNLWDKHSKMAGSPKSPARVNLAQWQRGFDEHMQEFREAHEERYAQAQSGKPWKVQTSFPDDFTMEATAEHEEAGKTTHSFKFNPDTNKVEYRKQHRSLRGGVPVTDDETEEFDSVDALRSFVRSRPAHWAELDAPPKKKSEN